MKLHDQDKEWIKAEIGIHVKSEIAATMASAKPHGLQRFFSWLKNWGLATVPFAVSVSLLALAGAAWYQAFARIKEDTAFQTKTEDRLTAIEATLRETKASSDPKKVLQELATLDKPQLTANLPAVRRVSEQPIESVKPAPQLLKTVAANLSKVDENSEGYWPAVLKFISFASAGLANNAPPPGSPVNGELSNDIGLGNMPPGRVYRLAGKIENITFTNSRIVFTDEPVYFRNVHFIGCAFDMPDLSNPPTYLKATGQELLASGLTSATLNTGM